MRIIDVQELIEDKENIIKLIQKYYNKLRKNDSINADDLYSSILNRFQNEDITFIVWGDYDGFLTVDWKTNPVTNRLEGIIWTVLNPKEGYKKDVLDLVDKEGKKRKVEAIVFFSENPMVFKKLIDEYGYKLTFGFFEKKLKEV